MVARKDIKKCMNVLTFGDKRGDWRVSAEVKEEIASDKFKMVENEKINIPNYEQKQIDIEDEWNARDLAEKIVKHRLVSVKARFPGSGKTHACKEIRNMIANVLTKQGYNILFVCPTNFFAQPFDDDGATVLIFFIIT